MKKLVVYLAVLAAALSCGAQEPAKTGYGSGAPSAVFVPGPVGSIYVDQSTNIVYFCTQIAIVNHIPNCTWTQETSATSLSQLNGGTAPSGQTYDFSGVTLFKLRIGAGLTTTANGDFGFDSTNNNWHGWNGADVIFAPLAAGFVSGHCGQPTSTAGSWVIADTGTACGSGGGSLTATAVGFGNGSNLLTGDATNFFYNSTTHALTLTGPISASSFITTGTAGGVLVLTNGSAPTNTANSFTFSAPTTITTGYTLFAPTGGPTALGPLVTDASGNLGYAFPSANSQCYMAAAANFATTAPSFQSCPTAPAFQVDAVGLLSASTINFQDSAATNGLTLGFTNPSAGNIQLTLAGQLTNAGLANSTITPNGFTCTLGSTCNVGSLFDSGGLASLTTTAVASGVDNLNVKGAATANPATVTLSAVGSDANINVNIVSKGTGAVQCNGGSCAGSPQIAWAGLTSGTPSGTKFLYFTGIGTSLPTGQVAVQQKIPRIATISNLHVILTVAEGAAATLAITLMDGATAEAVTCTVGNSATTCDDVTHTFTTASLDLMSWQVVQTGTGTAQGINITFEIQ